MNGNKKVGFISLGCPKNLVDSEVMMGQLKQSGYEITPDAADAETGAAELRLQLDAGDRRAQLGRTNRCGVPAGASAQDGDVTFHCSTFPSEVSGRC